MMNYCYIESKNNANIKHARALRDLSKYRYETHEFLVEGARLCEEALQNNAEIKTFFFTKAALIKHETLSKSLISRAGTSYEVNENIINYICDTKSPQGIVCVCEMLDKRKLEDTIKLGSCIILEDIQNPANLGTILRTANALGVGYVVMSTRCCDVYSPKVLRGSMGAVFSLPFCICGNLALAVNQIKQAGAKVYAAVPGPGSLSITELKREGEDKIAVAIGNEANGLTGPLIEQCSELITIPMAQGAESLNAAVAAGIIMWEMSKIENLPS